MSGRILRWLIPFRMQVGVALVAISIYAVLQTIPPLLSKLAIDSYLAAAQARRPCAVSVC